MRSDFNGDIRPENANWLIAWSRTEFARLTTCSGASNDTINIRPGQGPSSCDSSRGWMRLRLESRSSGSSCELY
jgi:hypothetical protein